MSLTLEKLGLWDIINSQNNIEKGNEKSLTVGFSNNTETDRKAFVEKGK
jgi:hypothetical protein